MQKSVTVGPKHVPFGNGRNFVNCPQDILGHCWLWQPQRNSFKIKLLYVVVNESSAVSSLCTSLVPLICVSDYMEFILYSCDYDT